MLLYTITIFLSAFLLFQVQPIMAKIALPWFGGSASVWAACMLFFQFFLLMGYLYSHLVVQRLSPRLQSALHGAVLAVSLLLLRMQPDPSWKPAGGEEPVLRILGMLASTVGLPYLLLSTTGPLLQAWYARTYQVAFPYWLYSVSNLGSFLALLSYPVIIEPALGVSRQTQVWSAGYVAFCAACAACAWLAWRSRTAEQPEAQPVEPVQDQEQTIHLVENSVENSPEQQRPAAPAWHDYLLWVLLAACSSTLLLAVTNYVCQNIAPVPLLWVLPLSLYLLSFIITFGSEKIYEPGAYLGLLALALSGLTFGVIKFDGSTRLLYVILLFLAGLFICCLVCHGELARRKPHARYLTGFYLAVSLGGALGGLFVGWLAPYIFRGYWEMSVGLAFTAVLGLWIYWRSNRITLLAWTTLALVICWTLFNHERAVAREARVMVRNFYGALRVTQDGGLRDPLATRTLVHGTITHGVQYLALDRRRLHTTYYAGNSGVGLAIETTRRPGQRVGVIGLGTGTIASYGREGDYYRFYDINPQVVEIARREFTYLMDCPAKVDIVLGDARLSLEREPPQNFDVLAVDAFSSDMIPVHLLTIEAFREYFRHLRSDGILAVHVSNRHLALEPVVQLAAEALGKAVRLVENGDGADLVYGSTWVLLASKPEVLDRPEFEPHNLVIQVKPGLRLWTDDYSNLWKILQL